MIGPAPAGLLVRSWGIAVALLLDALSFLGVIAALFRIPDRPAATAAPATPATPATPAITAGAPARPGMLRSIADGLRAVRNDPALLSERLRSPFQREQKPWDKGVMAVMLALWIGWLILMGLDRRYHWSNVPTALKAIGLALIVLGSYLVLLTLKANSYAAPVVKIQTGRGHAVATTGPYAYVRHPMYAGALLFIAGVPLLLGSWWGLAAAPALVLIIAVRAVFEERTLDRPGLPRSS